MENSNQGCAACGAKVTYENSGLCPGCFDAAEEECAKTTVIGHLLEALICLFWFQFSGILMELIWAVERLTRTGDYGPKGRFQQRGIRWWEPLK